MIEKGEHMREIRFRAWIKNDRRMIEWFPQFFADTSPVTSYGDDFPENDDNVVLMQYTGLKDKKGVEIYEGDVYIYRSSIMEERGQITYLKGCFWCAGINVADINELFKRHGLEVIGNIYENPDLLK
jgi:hypothetical protein